MKVASKVLIEDLIERTQGVLNAAEKYNQLSLKELNNKVAPDKWSALECIEHLNRYGDFYLPEIKSRIAKGKKSEAEATFKSGLLGNYFAESMLPKEKLNKMSTFKSMNPAGSQLDKGVLTKFIAQQKEILNLLDSARTTNLTKTKTGITISNFIKLRLGDTFRVVIYHNQRHIVQANNAIL